MSRKRGIPTQQRAVGRYELCIARESGSHDQAICRITVNAGQLRRRDRDRSIDRNLLEASLEGAAAKLDGAEREIDPVLRNEHRDLPERDRTNQEFVCSQGCIDATDGPPSQPGVVGSEPEENMRVDEEHYRSARQRAPVGATRSPRTFTIPLRKPRNVFGFFATGTSCATGFPRFVTTIDSPDSATSSIAWRHFALNSAADMVRAIRFLS